MNGIIILMPLPINEITKLIKESIPDASIEIKDLMGTIITMKLQLNLQNLII